MTNTFNLADYAPKGRAEFDEAKHDSTIEAKHDSKIEVVPEPKPAATRQRVVLNLMRQSTTARLRSYPNQSQPRQNPKPKRKSAKRPSQNMTKSR